MYVQNAENLLFWTFLARSSEMFNLLWRWYFSYILQKQTRKHMSQSVIIRRNVSVAPDTGHTTCDIWHVSHDIQGWWKSAKNVWRCRNAGVLWRFGGKGSWREIMIKGVYRTASARPCLLIILWCVVFEATKFPQSPNTSRSTAAYFFFIVLYHREVIYNT